MEGGDELQIATNFSPPFLLFLCVHSCVWYAAKSAFSCTKETSSDGYMKMTVTSKMTVTKVQKLYARPLLAVLRGWGTIVPVKISPMLEDLGIRMIVNGFRRSKTGLVP